MILFILGIVFLIVALMVFKIIRSVKISVDKISIDNYGKTVEMAMEEYQVEYLKYPDSIDELGVEYTGSVIECDVRRINPDYTIYLSECKVNGEYVNYDYGSIVLTDEEYVDKLGTNIEIALKEYYEKNRKYPVNYRLLDLPKIDKDVNCVSDMGQYI